MATAAQLPPFLAAVLGDTSDVSDANAATAAAARSLDNNASTTRNGQADEEERQQEEEERAIGRAILQRSSSSVSFSDALRPSSSSPFVLSNMSNAAADFAAANVLSTSTLLVPPLNFDMVCATGTRRSSNGSGGAVYRSGFPNERNNTFLATLQLRTVIYLSSDDVRPNLQSWIDASQGKTRLLHFRLNVNKEPFAEMDKEIVGQALSAILDQRNLPILMHCNKGKYRVGVLTALIRRLQGWSLTSIYEEYARFAGHDRIADEEFIDMFPLQSVSYDARHAPDWLRL